MLAYRPRGLTTTAEPTWDSCARALCVRLPTPMSFKHDSPGRSPTGRGDKAGVRASCVRWAPLSTRARHHLCPLAPGLCEQAPRKCFSRSNRQSIRRRRSTSQEDTIESSRMTFISPFGDNRVRVYFKRSGQRQATISCVAPQSDNPYGGELDFEVVCATVICRLGKLSHADAIRISLTGWLWAPTFFKYQLPDVNFVNKLSLINWGPPPKTLLAYPSAILEYPENPPSYELAQTIVFRGVTGKYLEQIQLWPIVVGVVLGSILLFSLIASLYCCGFFRRRQKTKEAKRKSMMAARSRASAHAGDDHPSAFLLQKNANGKDVSANGKRSQTYTANPMHAESPNLIYAPGPQPPTPPPQESNDVSNRNSDWVFEFPSRVGLDAAQSGDDAVGEHSENDQFGKKEPLVTNGDRDVRDASSSSSSGIPDWLMSELKENEVKSKKSLPNKNES
uniref:ZP domain-containing protein n=1 Tax=Mesocestoides corti TaxID=53468 RepID=A0A5K3FV35_MESCO